MTPRMRVAAVGTGHIFDLGMGPALAASESVEVVAVVDPLATNRERNRHRFAGCRLFESIQELLHEGYDVQGLVVSAPTPAHWEVLSTAATSDAWILCEKPVLVNSEHYAQLLRDPASRKKVMAVHNRIFEPAISQTRQQVRRGDVGSVLSVDIVQICPAPFPSWSQGRTNWRTEGAESGGGVTLDLGYHALYLGEYLTGETTGPVRAVSRKTPAAARGESLVSANIALGATASLNLTVGWIDGVDHHTVRIWGTDGTIEIVMPEALRVTSSGSTEERTFHGGLLHSYQETLAAWVAVATGQQDHEYAHSANLITARRHSETVQEVLAWAPATQVTA